MGELEFTFIFFLCFCCVLLHARVQLVVSSEKLVQLFNTPHILKALAELESYNNEVIITMINIFIVYIDTTSITTKSSQ